MKAIPFTVLLILIFALEGCNTATSNNPGSNNTSGASTTYTLGNAEPAITVLNEGIVQASLSTSSTDPAYYTGAAPGSGSGATTLHLSGYTPSSPTSPYVLTGSLTEVLGTPKTLNGTVNYTGGSVTAIQYNNVTSTPSGTYTITFTGNVVYTFNLATNSFTIN